MSKPIAQRCAELAYSLASGGRTIPYVYGGTTLKGLDCRGFVLYIIRALGGTVRFSGATDLWDNYLSYKDTTAKAKAAGKLVPGALLFHWDGKTAEHVGWYTGIKGKEVAHASKGNGKVVLSPLSNYYDHVGWTDAVDYAGGEDVSETDSPGTDQLPAPGPGQAVVVSDTLRARISLSTKSSSNVKMQMRKGQVLTDIQTGFVFDSGEPAVYGFILGASHPYVYAAIGNPKTGEQYLQLGDSASAVEDPLPARRLLVIVSGREGAPLTIEQAINLKDEYRAAGFDVTVEEE